MELLSGRGQPGFLLVIVIAITISGTICTSSFAENIPRTCPTDYDYYSKGNKCYKFYDDKKTWYKARETCQREKSDLFVMQDEDTGTFIYDLITIDNNLIDYWIWMGLREVAYTKYKWSDNNPLAYTAWKSPEPNNGSPLNFDNCALDYIAPSTKNIPFYWHDAPCLWSYPFVCEKPLDIYPACPSGYVTYTEGNKCVKAVQDQVLTWEGARRACQRDGGDLVVIPDQYYNAFVKRVSKGINSWIGFRDSEITPYSYDFRWINGESLNYSDWHVHEPNYERSFVQVVCGQFYNIGDQFMWNDMPCSNPFPFLCEQEFNTPLLCPGDGWALNTNNSKCYKVQMEKRSYGESRAQCQQDGGDLVVITDDVTTDYVKKLLDITLQSVKRVFVGLTVPYGRQTFEWLDGTPVGNDLEREFNRNTGQYCGTVENIDGIYKYTDMYCNWTHSSMCQKDASYDFPTLECPHGYTTYVMTSDNEWRVTCLMAENNDNESYSDAIEKCQNVGGDLLQMESDLQDMHSFIRENLLEPGNWYWYKNEHCYVYNVSEDALQKQCSDTYGYICQHWGIVRTFVNLTQITSIDKSVYVSSYGTLPKSCLSDVCQATNLAELRSLHDWTRTSTHVSIITDMNLTRLTMENQNKESMLSYQQNGCYVKATLRNAEDVTEKSKIIVTFPMENILCICEGRDVLYLNDVKLCPGKLRKESVELYKNMTTPKNGSTTPNKLCPCRCDNKNIDFNPSPQVLAEIVFKIQKELKVDNEKLSGKRNKKISAPDSRTGSQAIAYVAIVLSLIPFGLLVAADLSRMIHFFYTR